MTQRTSGATGPRPAPASSPSPLPHAAVLSADVESALAAVRPREIVIGLLTYDNAATVGAVVDAAAEAVARGFDATRAALVHADAGSSDATAERVAATALPTVRIEYGAPLAERLTVPFHGVPGRGTALAALVTAAHRLGARALVLLEADVTSTTPGTVERLLRPVLEQKADFVSPAYARHRYEGTITNLLLAPLVRALYGRRLRQPLGGQQALSGRLVEHLLVHPRWGGFTREIADLWVLGTAIADGFNVWEAWLGRRVVQSATRSTDLPAMVAQTVGAVFGVMHRHDDLWGEVRGSEPVPEVGEPARPTGGPARVDVRRMVNGFRLGVHELLTIWEYVLAPDTLAEVLALGAADDDRFRFGDDLWARVVYDFALGYHYDVVHHDHLLRSLVPLYLGRTAAFVRETETRGGEETEAVVEGVALAFERHKRYLTERWR